MREQPNNACQRCFQQRQGLVPLSDLVRELHDLGIGTLICRSCMKEMVAVSNFLAFQGCWIQPHPMLVKLSRSTTEETSENSQNNTRKDFAVEPPAAAEKGNSTE